MKEIYHMVFKKHLTHKETYSLFVHSLWRYWSMFAVFQDAKNVSMHQGYWNSGSLSRKVWGSKILCLGLV